MFVSFFCPPQICIPITILTILNRSFIHISVIHLNVTICQTIFRLCIGIQTCLRRNMSSSRYMIFTNFFPLGKAPVKSLNPHGSHLIIILKLIKKFMNFFNEENEFYSSFSFAAYICCCLCCFCCVDKLKQKTTLKSVFLEHVCFW